MTYYIGKLLNVNTYKLTKQNNFIIVAANIEKNNFEKIIIIILKIRNNSKQLILITFQQKMIIQK